MSEDSKYITCAFCSWKTPRFRKLKSGKTSSPDKAWSKLDNHVWLNHEKEWNQIKGEQC